MSFRSRLHRIIFEADTPLGKIFDILLLWAICLSVLAVCLESVAPIRERYGDFLRVTEWVFTILFTIEYLLRLYCVERPMRYARSFFGIVDLLAIVPTYLSLFLADTHYLLVIRVLRLLRVFRVLKLVQFLGEAEMLMRALRASRYKVTVFLGGVLSLVVIAGAVMHLIEGPENGFTSIPKSMYWAIVTLTTVGYGDVSPATPLGQFLASLVMVMGYGVIAVPTGIVSVELNRAYSKTSTKACLHCGRGAHDDDALFCKFCGGSL